MTCSMVARRGLLPEVGHKVKLDHCNLVKLPEHASREAASCVVRKPATSAFI